MRQIITSPTFVFAVFFIYIGTGLIGVPLHYQVRRRLKGANVQVRWSPFTNAIETWRMYQAYRDQAPTRGWNMWPYYFQVAFLIETVLFGFVILAVIFVGR